MKDRMTPLDQLDQLEERDERRALALDRLLSEVHARRKLPAPKARRLIRERAGLSQGDLAQVLDVSIATVSRWESGQCLPARSVYAAYANVLQRLAQETKEAA
jgi:DNA-binding transcriptional regulator YiaG